MTKIRIEQTKQGFIQDDAGHIYDQKSVTQFRNVDITQENDKIVIDLATVAKPYTPSIVRPINESSNIPLLYRFVFTPYGHPFAVPMENLVFQINTAEDFSGTMIFDKTLVYDLTNAIAVTTDEGGDKYLSVNTDYYARVKYRDAQGHESHWSEVVKFTTTTIDASAYILAPHIIMPPDGGTVTEKNLVVQLSQPEAFGTTDITKSDIQLSTTPDFETSDIFKSYDDVNSPVIMQDTTVDLQGVMAPIYMRARQKDTARAIISPWSSIPTIWIQRTYSGLVFGWEEKLIMTNTTDRYWASTVNLWPIDGDGNHVAYPSDYFENHPIYAGLRNNVKFKPLDPTDQLGNIDMAWIPVFYYKIWRDPADKYHRKFLFSPTQLDGYVKHPAFLAGGSENGFYVSRTLNTQVDISDALYLATNGVRCDLSLTFMAQNSNQPNLTQMKQGIITTQTLFGDSKFHAMNVWERSAIINLMIAEAMTYNLLIKYGGMAEDGIVKTNLASSPKLSNFHDIYAFVNNAPSSNYASALYVTGIKINGRLAPNISDPLIPNNALIVDGLSELVQNDSYNMSNVVKLYAEDSEDLNAPIDLLFIPQWCSLNGVQYYENFPLNHTVTSDELIWIARTTLMAANYKNYPLCRLCKYI